MLRILTALAFLLIANEAVAHQYTCEEVRAAHKKYGSAVLRNWAKEFKVPLHQQRQAIRCLHSRHVKRVKK